MGVELADEGHGCRGGGGGGGAEERDKGRLDKVQMTMDHPKVVWMASISSFNDTT
jgi:hypothetical protein